MVKPLTFFYVMLSQITKPTKIEDLSSQQLKDLQINLSRLGYYPTNLIDGIYGPATKKAWSGFKRDRFLDQPSFIGPASAATLLDAEKSVLVNLNDFNRCFKAATPADRENYFMPINVALREFSINTPRRIAHFFAQIAHESANLKYSEEIASGQAYEGRRDLGNIYPGDGKKFKGRGLIQLTGRSNYHAYGKALKLNLIENPELAKSPYTSARIAGLYWQSNQLNSLADQDDLNKITRRINGGYNGLEDRRTKLMHMKAVLKTS